MKRVGGGVVDFISAEKGEDLFGIFRVANDEFITFFRSKYEVSAEDICTDKRFVVICV